MSHKVNRGGIPERCRADAHRGVSTESRSVPCRVTAECGLASRARGFTLIEVLIIGAIVAILAALAYPSFNRQIMKTRRADAFALMMQVQQAQEIYRAEHRSYAGSSDTLPGVPASPYYGVAWAAGPPAASTGLDTHNSYTITATANGGQKSDSGCQVLRILGSRGTVTYLAGADANNLADVATGSPAASCWSR